MEQEINKSTVLIEDWEMQCCGEPFKVGDTVEWTVSKCEDENENFLAEAGNIDFNYDNHFYSSEKILKIKGNVTNIRAIHYSYKPESENSKVYIPVTGISVEVESADGWDEDVDGKRLSYYYVCLENVKIKKYEP